MTDECAVEGKSKGVIVCSLLVLGQGKVDVLGHTCGCAGEGKDQVDGVIDLLP